MNVPYLQACCAGNGEDSNRVIPLGDSVSRENLGIGDAIRHSHHHRRGGISEVDAHELRAAASQLGTLFEGAMGHGGLQTSSHIPLCPPLPTLPGNTSTTRRLSRRRLMDNKRGYPFPKVRIPLARKAPPARIARGAMGHQAPSWPLPASLVGDTFTTSAPSSTMCAARRLSRRRLTDNNRGHPFPIVSSITQSPSPLMPNCDSRHLHGPPKAGAEAGLFASNIFAPAPPGYMLHSISHESAGFRALRAQQYKSGNGASRARESRSAQSSAVQIRKWSVESSRILLRSLALFANPESPIGFTIG
eukprot:jgi/Botrbrau1/18829/Bobra.0661s0003.2